MKLGLPARFANGQQFDSVAKQAGGGVRGVASAGGAQPGRREPLTCSPPQVGGGVLGLP